jgi:hypothetical protein
MKGLLFCDVVAAGLLVAKIDKVPSPYQETYCDSPEGWIETERTTGIQLESKLTIKEATPVVLPTKRVQATHQHNDRDTHPTTAKAA